jgi:hypothetical protein
MPRPQDKISLIIAIVLDAYLIACELFGPFFEERSSHLLEKKYLLGSSSA